MERVPRWKVFSYTFNDNVGELVRISDEGVGGETAEGAALSAQGLGVCWQFWILDFGFWI